MTEELLNHAFGEVRVLPDDLSNQIAAGEVVERPASAVRELIENSLDAGATRVEVELLDGGAQLIRVSDNGRGMSPDDAERAIQRHATSKIATREDLFRIASYGFRGEALPSIASVSRFELVTRTKASFEGTRVVVDGGSLKLVEPWSTPVGTTITVRDLFFNTPARRKFLRQNNTEQRYCIETIELIALPRPDVSFRLKVNERVVLDLPAVEDIWQRIAAVEGYDNSKMLYPAPVAEQDGVSAWGFVGEPTYTTRHPMKLRVFVNGRSIRDRMLLAAVRQGYETLIDRGRSPVAYMFVSVPLDELDVNVHPAKTEVRFNNQNAVFRALRRSVNLAVIGAPWVKGNQTVRSEDAAKVYHLPRTSQPQEPQASVDPLAQGDLSLWSNAPQKRYSLDKSEPASFHGGAGRLEVRSDGLERRGAGIGTAGSADSGPVSGHSHSFSDDLSHAADGAAPASAVDDAVPVKGWFQSLHYIGPLHRLYLLLSGPDGMVIIDQHAAHERITYERLRTTWRNRDVVVQQLLVPDVISLNAHGSLTLLDHLDFFSLLGFELEHFGENDFTLRGVPDWFGPRDFRPMLLDALDDLAVEGATVQIEQALDAILSRMACHGSIRAGDTVSSAEVRTLLADLDRVDFGANCPHGRPVYLPVTLEELEIRFERR